MAELEDLRDLGPEEGMGAAFDPVMLQQVISWKKGYPDSGGPFSFLNEDDETVLTFIEGDGLYATPDDGSSGDLGRVLVDDFHGFVGMIVETDVDPATLEASWHVCDGTGGTPDLRGLFVVGVSGSFALGATGGTASINLQHSHDLANHTHDLASHTHTLASHTHDLANHTHNLGDHRHDLANHTHTLVAAGVGGSIGTENNQANVMTDASGQEAAASFHTHSHSLDVTGTTDTPSSNTSGSPTADSLGPSSNTSGAPSSNTSGTPSANTSGTPSNNTSGTTLSATQSILPPYYALYRVQRVA